MTSLRVQVVIDEKTLIYVDKNKDNKLMFAQNFDYFGKQMQIKQQFTYAVYISYVYIILRKYSSEGYFCSLLKGTTCCNVVNRAQFDHGVTLPRVGRSFLFIYFLFSAVHYSRYE